MKMIDNGATLPTSGKSIDQLNDEFKAVNEQALEIQAQMAKVAEQLAQRGATPVPPQADQSTIETVEF
jgi:hypothetical protein